jgi:5-methylthioadenosine/S-adenosylhomocysteine deaminase
MSSSNTPTTTTTDNNKRSRPDNTTTTTIPTNNPSPFSVEILIRARYLATVDINNTVLENAIVAINNVGTIVGIHTESNNNNGIPPYQAKRVFTYPSSIVIPGFINTHTHAAMALMRGFGDDMKLTDWLVTRIWPAEAKCISPEYVSDGTRLAIQEMLLTGTTTFQDMYFFPDSIEQVVQDTGIRAVIGQVVIAFPTPYTKSADDALSRAETKLKNNTMNQQPKNGNNRVRYAVTPHAPYSVQEKDLVRAFKLSQQYSVPFITHLHECFEEIRASVALDRSSGFCHMSEHKSRPLATMDHNGIVNHTCLFAHMTQLEDEEISLLAKRGANVAHCPSSNLKLASGFCPVAKLLEAGVNVSIGTDGAASNNSLDLLAEMKLAALLAKGVSLNPCVVPAQTALRMATINGAKALGLDSICGSLEVNKQADITVIELQEPIYDPLSTLVYASSRQSVKDVFVNGQLLVENGMLCNQEKFKVDILKWKTKIEQVKKELDEA